MSSEHEDEVRERLTRVETNLVHVSEQQEEMMEMLEQMQEGRSIEDVKAEHREVYFWYTVARYAVGTGLMVGTSGILAVEFVIA